jgi:AcrR family transcriptional regulator
MNQPVRTRRRGAAQSARNTRPTDPYHHGDLRAALLSAAEEMLIDLGVEHFTLRECARRAGVSHAAPAHHFGDARGLLTEIATLGFERLSARIHEYIARAPDDPAEQLTAVGQAYIDFALEHRAQFQLMFRHDRLDAESVRLRDASQSTLDALLTALTRAASAEELVTRAFDAKIVLAWSAVHGFATLYLEGAFAHLAQGQPAKQFAAQKSVAMLRLLQSALVSAAPLLATASLPLNANAVTRPR